ncbi:glycosyltransferase [Patescibacteria group bacterium]|nr:glycosyltransferase [Patescibacteria group bacterium]MBU1952090.1 glycosyltransferase [Patescibacteria group bacterium]
MSNPAISVIMSAFNGENYLTEAIKSVLDQSFSNFEFIIINDGSIDNSLTIINGFAESDKRITVINNPVNLGLTKSLNIGLKCSKGKYIARMDCDDIAFTDRFEKQYNFLEENLNVFLLGSEAIKIDANGNKLNTVKLVYGSNNIKRVLESKNCLIHPTILFRNIKGMLYREKFTFSQDYDFYLNLLTKNLLIDNLNQPLIYHRVLNEKSVSSINLKQQLLNKSLASKFYFERTKLNHDSYDKLVFENLNNTLDFLEISEKELNNKVIELNVLSYLQKQQYSFAKDSLKSYDGNYFSKLLLSLIVTMPNAYNIYRFLRYKNNGS